MIAMDKQNQDLCRVLVLDMQPIDPPLGGGRLRLLGLYHGLGCDMPTLYVGTYDWPGERFREHKLSPTLTEVDIPLSNSHFGVSEEWKARAGGKNVIDVTFHQLAHHSVDYLERVRAEIPKADILFFSHPWVYPPVRDAIDVDRQLVVYDSHNVEAYLRAQLLDDGGFGTEIVKEVIRIEYEICHRADLVLACSHEDRELFHRLFDVPFKKMRVVPNGVFTEKITPISRDGKKRLKQELGLSYANCAIFIGSLYDPNLEAAEFIAYALAPQMPEIGFIVCGGVCGGLSKSDLDRRGISNVALTGFVSEEEKIRYLQASDMALNPMSSGSGTNIKMFDYFAAGLPTLSTATGARGIEEGSEPAFIVCALEALPAHLRKVAGDQRLQERLSQRARHFVEEKFSWSRISSGLGVLARSWRRKKKIKPFFSVVIPTYKRHRQLSILLERLQKQGFKDFEVVIVDQSDELWADRNRDFDLDLLYLHTDVKGAVKARNTGVFHSTGDTIAFIDDDCEPHEDWLQNARRYFDKPKIVGIEGLVKSDKRYDPDYRTVTNEGFEGFGFMTANLFIRSEVFNALNGFDERFDNPHFREDTDLGWRAQEVGEVPFAHDVRVYHPPHRRDVQRESLAERNRFFEKDALLLQKHPERYKELFLSEGHWRNTPGFVENLLRGAEKYGVELPEWCLEYIGDTF